MRLILALRLFKEWHAKVGIEGDGTGEPNGKLIDLHVDRLYPALKNIKTHLTSSGRLSATRKGQVMARHKGKLVKEGEADCPLYWCEVETDLPLEFWQSRHEVAVAIDKEEFESFAMSIRCRSGAAYIDACEEYANSISIHDDKPLRYEPPRQVSKAAA